MEDNKLLSDFPVWKYFDKFENNLPLFGQSDR
jgi:hypothetical protein